MRLSHHIAISLCVSALAISSASAKCKLPQSTTYADVEQETLPAAIERFKGHFCPHFKGRTLRGCLTGLDRTAIIFDIESGGSPTAAFTYSYAFDPLGTTRDDMLERIGFIVGLETDLELGIPSKILGFRVGSSGAVRLILERSVRGQKIVEEHLRVSEVTADRRFNFTEGQEWTVAGVGWHRGGTRKNATPNLREALRASSISRSIELVRDLARYLCDVKGTPWRFQLPGE